MRIEHPAKLASEGSPLENILEGFAFARNTGPIRAILLLLGLVSFVGMPYAVLMPVFADQILHGGARGLGILMGATGVGALLGAASLAARVGVKGLGQADRPLRRRLRHQPDPVFLLARLLAVDAAAAAGRLLHHGADGVVEHADSVHGARQAARQNSGRLLDDVHGHGAVRIAFGGRGSSSPGRAVDGGAGRTGLHRRDRFSSCCTCRPFGAKRASWCWRRG